MQINGTGDNETVGANSNVSFTGEIAAETATPEDAVFRWMYADAASGWGHRQNILGCYTYAGSGFAPAAGNTAATPGNGVYTVEFVTAFAGPMGAYKPLIVAANTPLPAPVTFSNGSLVPAADGISTLFLAANYATSYTAGGTTLTNNIRAVEIYPSSNWGAPNTPCGPPSTTCTQTLGVLPFGLGAVTPACPFTVANGVMTCNTTYTTEGDPVTLIVLDDFDNPMVLTLSP